MPPPPATSASSRIFLGPALRMQSDRRLVSLVHDGYESAFEEIVRRYGKPLVRYAAAIVTSNRAEDVTQDAFSKALLALRDTDKDIELRPWLYRIVRNTALNDLRDQPPPAAPLHENLDGVETPLDAAERHEEISELVRRLRALPDAQRAAIVMRELEGLSHEEIAAALGMTGGAARQAIHRARRTIRDAAGMLVPVPFLHFLLSPSAAGAVAGIGGAAAGGAAAGGGAGGGMAIKAGVATVLVAGSVGTGVAIKESSDGGPARATEDSAQVERAGSQGSSPGGGDRDSSGRGTGGDGEREAGDRRGGGGSDNQGPGGGSNSGPGPNSGPGSSGSGDVDGESSGPGSGSSGSGSEGSGSGSGGSGSTQSGSGSSGSDSSGSDSSGSGNSGSGSSGSGSSGSGGGSLED